MTLRFSPHIVKVNNMQYRELGTQGLKVSTMGLGCMGMSAFYGYHDDNESIRTLHYAIDQGVTFLDTADIYGPHTNERLLARVLEGRRDQVVLATKFGILLDPSNPSVRGVNGRPDYVIKSCEESLKRLNVEVIDLYYQHRIDPSIPIEDTVGAMAELVKQGKVRYLGLSEASSSTLRRAHAVHPISALQMEYSLWSRDAEQNIFETCESLGIGFVAYSPLGRGFLSGAIKSVDDFAADDYRRSSPRFMGDNFNKNLRLVAKIKQLAEEKNCTASQLALAWVISAKQYIVPIPGTTKCKNLQENINALDIILSRQEWQDISDFFPVDLVAGSRYPDELMRIVNV